MDYLEAIKVIQLWYKKKLYMRQALIKKLNAEFDEIYNIIYSMMNRVHESFINGIKNSQ